MYVKRSEIYKQNSGKLIQDFNYHGAILYVNLLLNT